MLISNFGLFWRIEDVFWGTPKNSGRLIGCYTRAKSAGEVNFREQSGIYALYADYDLIYVGQTGGKGQKLLKRLNDHRTGALAKRWNMFSWFGTRSVLETGDLKAEKQGTTANHGIALNHLEAILIHVAEPPLNRQGGRWGREVEQYLQVRDPKLGLSENEMVEQVWDVITKGLGES